MVLCAALLIRPSLARNAQEIRGYKRRAWGGAVRNVCIILASTAKGTFR